MIHNSKKCGDGCIAGAVIGSIVGFGVLVGGFWYFTQYQKMSSGGSDVVRMNSRTLVQDSCGFDQEREESGRDESGRGQAPASSQPPAVSRTVRAGWKLTYLFRLAKHKLTAKRWFSDLLIRPFLPCGRTLHANCMKGLKRKKWFDLCFPSQLDTYEGGG